MSAEFQLDSESKLDVLKMTENSHRQEIMHHREIQFRAFSWTNALFLALFGGLIAIRKAEISIGVTGSLLLTIIIASITVTTLILINRSRQALESNAAVVVKVDRKMGLFTSGAFGEDDPIYPEKWLEWGDKRKASFETWFYLSNTVILGVAVIVGAWVLI